jgi:RimJ/RimL family protein N-acetyltransferase
MSHPTWPLFDLRLTGAGVALRPMVESDLGTVAAILPDDLELNPAATTYPNLDVATGRRVVVHQEFWQGWGGWSIESWLLGFVVEVDARIVGMQTLEGEDFPLLRTVDSASWLVPEVRGRGVGKAMRTAVLALAFGPLEAQCAITSAWDDNHASLGVSRSIGYQANGQYRHRRHDQDGVGDDRDRHGGGRDGDRAGSMVHLRLTREDWLLSGAGEAVGITGFEACRPYFGVWTGPPG